MGFHHARNLKEREMMEERNKHKGGNNQDPYSKGSLKVFLDSFQSHDKQRCRHARGKFQRKIVLRQSPRSGNRPEDTPVTPVEFRRIEEVRRSFGSCPQS